MTLLLKYKSARKLNLQLVFLAFFLLLLLGSCATYKMPTESFISTTEINNVSSSLEKEALQHPLYKIIPRHRTQIKWYDIGHFLTWMLFGNDDDGIFGEGPKAQYKLNDPVGYTKAGRWICRNPLHNFCFYVIGSAYTTNSEFALIKMNRKEFNLCTFKKKAEGNYGKGSFFFLGFHGWKPYIFLRLLYSQKYKGQWYLGWRERGNFGVMFLPFTTVKPDDYK